MALTEIIVVYGNVAMQDENCISLTSLLKVHRRTFLELCEVMQLFKKLVDNCVLKNELCNSFVDALSGLCGYSDRWYTTVVLRNLLDN
jgi:hypothetical protein